MAKRKHANNTATTLASGISDTDVSMTLTSATGFPAIGAGEVWRATITDGTDYEIVECTDDASSPTMTITRGMEGTTARTWSAGAKVLIMGTADSWDRKWDTAETSAAGLGILDTDDTLAGNSDTKIPSQKAVKTYADSHYAFKTISVSGQSDVVADSSADTLTLVPGTNVTITTDAGTGEIIINSSGGGGGGGRDRDAYTQISTSGGTTTLTVSSTYKQYLTGTTAGDIVKMPVASTVTVGMDWLLVNDSTVSVDIQSSGSNSILKMAGNTAVVVTCILASGTTAASWAYQYVSNLGGVFYPFASSTGNVTLTGASPYLQYCTGSSSVNNTMPVAATLVNGQSFCWVNNKSSGDVVVYASDNVTILLTIPIGYMAEFTCKDSTGGTGATPWVYTVKALNAIPPTGAATQSNQETATSLTTFVSPGRQHYHPSAAKAWAKFGVTGNILASYNVSSITDVGTGDAIVNFTVAFSSANYAVAACPEANGSAGHLTFVKTTTGYAAGSCELYQANSSTFALVDPLTWAVAFFGDQ